MKITTIGHGTLTAEELTSLLGDHGIEHLIDIRSFPGSRHNPQFGSEAMQRWVPESGLEYEWLSALGGRRKPVPDSRHTWWRNESFRAYADHMETTEFREGIEKLFSEADKAHCAVMCSESVWWRCHRRMVADYLVAIREVEVGHLMHDGRVTEHPLSEGLRIEDDHTVVYDVGVTPPLKLDDSES